MAELMNEVDWQNAEDMPDFELIPNGDQIFEITGSEVKPTKADDGKYITFTFKVIEGEYEKRLVFKNVNIENKSEKARNFGLSTLKKICEAVGLQKPLSDTEELHGVPLIAEVYTIPASGQYAAKNDVRSFRKLEDRVPDLKPTRSAPSKPASKTSVSLTLNDDVPF